MDLCLRARAAGVPTIFDPRVRVRHLGGHATRPAYDGEPFELLAARRHAVVARNRGARGRPARRRGAARDVRDPHDRPRARRRRLAPAAARELRGRPTPRGGGGAAMRRPFLRREERPRRRSRPRPRRPGATPPASCCASSSAPTATRSSSMVRESRELHRPWTYPPERADQFDELVARSRRDDFVCLLA